MKNKRYKLKFETIDLKNQKDCIIFIHLTYFSMGCLVASSLSNEIIGFVFSGFFSIWFLSYYWALTHKTEMYFEEVRNG